MVWSFLQSEADFGRSARLNNQRRRIIHLLMQYGELSIPELCQFMKRSIPTGTKLVDDFESQGLLINAGKRESTGGRRPVTYVLNPDMGYVFSLEILLRSLRVHILNLEGNPVHAWESETFDIANHDESLALLLEIVPWLIKEHELPSDRILGAGVGITGRVNTRKGISHSFLHTGPPLCDRLTKAWKMPVFIDNDTHLLALGENTFGLAREMENVVCVNLSKGLAVSVIANGKLQSGHSGFAGEFGHLLAGVGKLRCVCGKTGCLETLVSGLALESAYLLATNKKLDYRKILTLPDSNSFSLSVELVKMGEQLGQSLAMLIDLLNPERIVLGGGFSPVLQRMYPAIHKGIHLHSLPQLSADCDLTISSLGERAAVLGAFALVTENLLVG